MTAENRAHVSCGAPRVSQPPAGRVSRLRPSPRAVASDFRGRYNHKRIGTRRFPRTVSLIHDAVLTFGLVIERSWSIGSGESRSGPTRPREPLRSQAKRTLALPWVRRPWLHRHMGVPASVAASDPGPTVAAAKPLRIALVAPVWLTVPPLGYGGTERVVEHAGRATHGSRP